MYKTTAIYLLGCCVLGAAEIPVNTWVRVADSPGDALGREAPPGRGANWTHAPETNKFYRFGGYTPRFSNALDEFDPQTGAWRRLVADDENYPTNRPGGAVEALVTWDSQRQVVWIAGGMSRGASGLRGIWSYNPQSGAFALENGALPQEGRMAFDPVRGIFVIAPPSEMSGRNITRVYSLSNRVWTTRHTNPTPQTTWAGNWPLVYENSSGRIVLVRNPGAAHGKLDVWAFDTAAFVWTILHDGTADPAPSAHNRRVFTIAADPVNGGILLHGGSDGREDERFGGRTVWNDTWFFDLQRRVWTEIATPGPTPLMGLSGTNRVRAITYRTAMTFDSVLGAIALSDPDLGVWRFRYAPGAPAGATNQNHGAFVEIGNAARGTPMQANEAERFREPPSALNPRIAQLADNTVIALNNAGFSGDEIPWDYDWHRGVFVKYGGCGNAVSTYWGGYGNDLSYYDPRTETFHVRRAGDVSGVDRPGTGCTRSIIYDTHRRIFWFYGGASGSPGNPQAAGWSGRQGTWSYDMETDRFTLIPPDGASVAGPPGHACYMVYDPAHRIIVAPGVGRTWIFDTQRAAWTLRNTPSSPSEMINYSRLVYVHSLTGTLRVAEVQTGRTSVERPAEARTAQEAAGNDTVFWRQIRTGGEWSEWTQRTLLYNHAVGDWRDLQPQGQPTFRNNKYGLAYDIVNDVVLLVGGNIGWNGPVVADIWAYRVKENAWVKLAPQGAPIPFGQNLRVVYDPRHNATLIASDNPRHIVAYRYKRGELPSPEQAPTVHTAAAANPAAVTANTTALSVLGADDGGEAALTYTWAATGTPPVPVTFSVNGNNAAKNTTATFTRAGSYTLQATIRDAGGLSVVSSVDVTVSQTLTTVTVTPSSATVTNGSAQQFTANALDQFGQPMSATPIWTVSGGGTIGIGGLFTATTVGGPFTVTATSGARSDTANVTVANSFGAEFCDHIRTFADGKQPLREIFISPTGNNVTGNGSQANPYQTIARALQGVQPGDAIRMLPGTYPGGTVIGNFAGTSNAPIWLGGVVGQARPVISGGSEGIKISRVRYVVIENIEVTGATANGINCDDGGDRANSNATRHVVFRNLLIRNIGTGGNNDGLKLSGVYDYFVLNCEFVRMSAGGSAIDHVGCHRGLIARSTFTDAGSNSIQLKGGSEDIEIRWNTFVNGGARAINIGGSTGFAFFRPPLTTNAPNFEAKNIRVIANLFRGSATPVAFVGTVNSLVANNTFIQPTSWLMRILQETVSSGGYPFLPCGQNRFINNLVYFSRSQISAYVNIGANTDAASFEFANNLWYAFDQPSRSRPTLPAPETNGIYEMNPLFQNAAAGDFSVPTNSPAAGKGRRLPGVSADLLERRYADPPTIGALEANSPAANLAPTVQTAAAANPATVTANNSALSVLGADDGGEPALTYTWAATGAPPAPVTFSVNGNNAAKNTTATFTRAGDYTLQVTITDAGGLSVTSSVGVTVTGVDAYGIPDWWKILHFGSTTAPNSDALADPDGDRMRNWAEWVAGTSPADRYDVLKIVELSAGGYEVSAPVLKWSSVTGRWYTIKMATNLITGFDRVLTNNVPATPPLNTQTVIVDQAGNRYFRVVVE